MSHVIPYLQRRSTGYYYRQRVPNQLRVVLGKTEIVLSLNTTNRKTANARAISVLASVHDLFNEVRLMVGDLSHTEAQEIAERWKKRALNVDFENRLAGRPDPTSLEDLNQQLLQLRNQIRTGVFHPPSVDIIDIARQHGLNLKPDTQSWRRLGYYLMCSHMDLYEEMKRRSDPKTPHLMQFYEDDGVDSTSPSLTISEALRGWETDGQSNPKTIAEWRTRIRHFIDLKGNMPVTEISTTDIRDLKDAYKQLPRKLKQPEYQYPLPDIIKTYSNRSVERLSASSINKNLSAIKSVLGWCVNNGYISSNPASGISVPAPKINRNQRLPFSPDDLKAIFEQSPVFRDSQRPMGGAGEAAYWLPVLALYTGCRIEELGQLSIDNVRTQGDIIYLDINPFGDGQSIKSQSSLRRVPLHKDVIGFGFMEYVASIAAKGYQDLFPHIQSRCTKRTAAFSKWVNRYLRKDCGIDDSRKVFHSFRHTFKDACREARIPKDQHDALTGHSMGSNVGDRYGNGYNLETLNDAIQKIRYEDLVIPDWSDRPKKPNHTLAMSDRIQCHSRIS